MSKITKLSDVVSSQFPNFVQDEYPVFIAFLEAYYTYLDQQKLTRSLEYIKDVDRTIDEFISYIKKEIAPEIPQNNLLYLQNAKQTQLARGSEESYRTLFRLLLKKEIVIEYPAEKMLRVSAGEWEQDTSFFLKVTSGNVFSLQNNFLYINCNKRQTPHRHRVYVKKIQRVETTLDVYEIFIARNFYGIIDIGDTVDYNGVTGVIEPATNKVKILQAGTGFKPGQVFNVFTSSASGLLVKVTKTTPEGGLKQLQIISFGVGFSKHFYYELGQHNVLSSSTTSTSSTISNSDSIANNVDSGVINKINYHSDYTEGGYVGEVLADFYTRDYSDASSATQIPARIFVQLGAICKYPGYYKSSNSLIDDDSYIQDGEFYQDFSYIIKIDEKLETYKDIVLSTLHPVGRKLFGEYRLESDFELNLEISNPVIRILIPSFSESDETVDALDRNIVGVNNIEFVGDGTKDVYVFYEDQSPEEILVLYVKINNQLIDRYYDWDVLDNTIIFADAPPINSKIEIRYAVISVSGSSSLQSIFFDLSKQMSDFMQMTDISNSFFTKDLSPLYGYIDTAYLGGLVQQDETDIRINNTLKVFPSLETLSSEVAAIEKDTLTIGDTGTSENADPSTNLTIKDFGKELLSFNTSIDLHSIEFAKLLQDAYSTQDVSFNNFSKFLSPQFGYTDEAKMAIGSGLTESDSTDYISSKNVSKRLNDTIASALFTETLNRSIEKALSSSSQGVLTDFNTTIVNKSISDSINKSNDICFNNFYKYLNDSISVADDIASLILSYELNDSLNIQEQLLSIVTNSSLTEIADTVDSSSISIIKEFTEQISINSTGYLNINPYSSEVYFAETYTVGRTQFTS